MEQPPESQAQEMTAHLCADHLWHLEKQSEEYRLVFERIYRRLREGLAQDPNFPRAGEYFSKMHKIRQAASAVGCSHGLRVSTDQFFQSCFQEAENDLSRAEQEIFQGRIERAEDLCYACGRSAPNDERELNKKKLFIADVLGSHLIPMRQEKITMALRTQLEGVIASYQKVLKDLEEFDIQLFVGDGGS